MPCAPTVRLTTPPCCSSAPPRSRPTSSPLQLRLVRDEMLVGEVTAASSTAPHLKRSRTLDEDGRGLLLVCELTQSWGTRQTTSGKTIWCQQVLSDPLLESA